MLIVDMDDNYDRALIGGFVASEQTRERIGYARDQFIQNVSRYRGDEYVSRFEDRSRALDLDILEQRAIAINRKMDSAFKGDMIYDIHDIGDFQNSSERMRMYLLSDPEINYRARNGRIEAWGYERERYAYAEDSDPRDNPYYRSMNDGYGYVVDDTDMEFESYQGQTDSDWEELTYNEQRALHGNRNLLLEILGENIIGGEDPTSDYNNKIWDKE